MKLSTKEITFLAGMYKAKTQLSLFASISAPAPLDGTEERSLAEKGIYKDRTLSQEAKEILDIIAKARRCSRLVLRDSFWAIEKRAYRTADKVALVENDDKGLLFSIPQDLSATISELAEFTGMSSIKTTSMEVLLSADEMMVLLAVMDIYRRNALITYLDESKTNSAIQFSQIVEQLLHKPMPDSLAQMLKTNYNYAVPQAERMKEVLERLIAGKCIVNGKGYELTDEYAAFANSFLIPETIVMLEAFDLNEKNEVISAEALCLCAGLKDIASFIFGKDEIELASISGMQLLQMTENFLRCPALTDSIYCKHCGAELPGNAHFCNGCGAQAPPPPPPTVAATEAPAHYCPQCGTQLKPSARFCDNCGTKIGN